MDQAQKRRRPGQSEMAKQIATGAADVTAEGGLEITPEQAAMRGPADRSPFAWGAARSTIAKTATGIPT